MQGALEGKTLVNKRSIVSVNVSNIVRILFDFAGNFSNFEVCVGRDVGIGDSERYRGKKQLNIGKASGNTVPAQGGDQEVSGTETS